MVQVNCGGASGFGTGGHLHSLPPVPHPMGVGRSDLGNDQREGRCGSGRITLSVNISICSGTYLFRTPAQHGPLYGRGLPTQLHPEVASTIPRAPHTAPPKTTQGVNEVIRNIRRGFMVCPQSTPDQEVDIPMGIRGDLVCN